MRTESPSHPALIVGNASIDLAHRNEYSYR